MLFKAMKIIVCLSLEILSVINATFFLPPLPGQLSIVVKDYPFVCEANLHYYDFETKIGNFSILRNLLIHHIQYH